ncbi:hypothetical protein ACFQFC_40900 [Amorphoplanes digitatis]|uniref:Energy-converting hydrogenase Eha subunit A n=1 Tax=Actinoplanes digitatis TaxID=1868 RepID=A0A7W7HXE1_9ACTN|nr:hypothetical protein [Actinoplanes digitatis]MBB4762534.1 energy-converting hydrogenase Eha subunit A [Actinoplanes digitatis]
MADQRSADQRSPEPSKTPDDARPDPTGVRPPAPDVQTTSGVPKTQVPAAGAPDATAKARAMADAIARARADALAKAKPAASAEDTVVLRVEPSSPEDTAVLTVPTPQPPKAVPTPQPPKAAPTPQPPKAAPTPQPPKAEPAPQPPKAEPPKAGPGEETQVILPRAADDTVVIPAYRVARPADVATAIIPVVPGRGDGPRTEAAHPPDPGRAPKPARPRREPLDLGHAPAVLTISALGVLMVALAYAGGRIGTGNAQIAYWIGQVVVFTPVVVRLLSRRMAGVAESFVLVMGLALNQYLLKWMYSPDQFRFPDELQHWLATTVILESGVLFRPNPALPPAEHFPGLAELGAAVAQLTGLPVTAAGVIVAGVAHLVFVGLLFAVVLRASNSPAVAGVACAIYATALHYLFFNSMFLYQTAALPFFMLTVWAVRRWRTSGGPQFAWLAVVSMALTTVSHHVTAFALVATLLLLAVAELTTEKPRRWSALIMPAAAAAVVAAWILLVATDVLGYLEEPVDQVTRTVSQLLSGASDPASTSAPVSLGQLAVQGAGLLGLAVLYIAVTRDMVQRHDRDWWRWAAVAGGLIFFAGNGVRFLGQNGPEIAGRLSTFTYIPISILAAIGLVRGVQLIPARDAEGHRWRAAAPAIDVVMPGGWNLYSRVAAGAAMITLLMIGARAGGWPPLASLLPGPYLAGGYERSVDAPGLEAAEWQRRVLGPGNRVGGDATSVSLASTYGRQDPVREVGPLYYADSWGLEQEDLVTELHLQYLVVDRRLGTQLPESGAYFEMDPRSGQITSPLTDTQLGKFDTLTDVDRMYDNGTVRVYRLGER